MFGQMYHHFQNGGLHDPGQGSIDGKMFRRVIRHTRTHGEILTPQEFRDAGAADPTFALSVIGHVGMNSGTMAGSSDSRLRFRRSPEQEVLGAT